MTADNFSWNETILLRIKCLRKMCNLRQSNDTRPIVYLDETWINQNHSRVQIWQNTDGLKVPTGKRRSIAHLSCWFKQIRFYKWFKTGITL